jgi:hypothetical protein
MADQLPLALRLVANATLQKDLTLLSNAAHSLPWLEWGVSSKVRRSRITFRSNMDTRSPIHNRIETSPGQYSDLGLDRI